MRYEIRLAVLFIEQEQKKRGRGIFVKRGARPLSSSFPREPRPLLSLSLLYILFFLLHHHARPPSSRNPKFSVSPARKSLDFASPSWNRPFDVKSGQIQRQPSMILVEMGCDLTPQARAKALQMSLQPGTKVGVSRLLSIGSFESVLTFKLRCILRLVSFCLKMTMNRYMLV